MPAPYDSIYMLIDRQVYNGQRVLNRYFYGTELSMSSNAEDLANEFAATMVAVIVGLQVPELIHTEIMVVNISDITDYYTLGINTPGIRETDGMPPQDAIGFRAAQPGYGLRPASKRIAGFPEDYQEFGNVAVTELSIVNVAAALGTPLEGADGEYYPCTVTLPSPFIPPVAVVPVSRDAVNWQARPFVSSQNTRKQVLG